MHCVVGLQFYKCILQVVDGFFLQLAGIRRWDRTHAWKTEKQNETRMPTCPFEAFVGLGVLYQDFSGYMIDGVHRSIGAFFVRSYLLS